MHSITKVGKESKIREAIELAKQNENILVVDYPKQVLDTWHDDELANSLKCTKEGDLEYLGAIFFGETETLKTLTKKFSLYK